MKRSCRIKCVLLETNILHEEYNAQRSNTESVSPRDNIKDVYISSTKPAVYTPKEIVNREPIIEKAIDIFKKMSSLSM